jgi:starch synthase
MPVGVTIRTGLEAEVLSKGLLPGKKECIDPLLLSAHYAEINTVSEEYAGEIMHGALEESTGGLGAAFCKAGLTLTGITNGIDLESYDPRTAGGASLPCAFNPLTGDLGGKRGCRLALHQRLKGQEIPGIRCYGTLNLSNEEPLYTFVGRLTGQKGVDILTGAVSLLLCRRAGARFLFLGQGERKLEEELISLSSELPAEKRFKLLVGYNSEIARLIFAAGDFFLIPSLYEPCGLTDFIAQLMGNLPIVHRVGGLIKVRDGFNGFSYNEHSVMELAETVMRTLELFSGNPETLTVMRSHAFNHILEHYTWEKVLKERYLPLYRLQGR